MCKHTIYVKKYSKTIYFIIKCLKLFIYRLRSPYREHGLNLWCMQQQICLPVNQVSLFHWFHFENTIHYKCTIHYKSFHENRIVLNFFGYAYFMCQKILQIQKLLLAFINAIFFENGHKCEFYFCDFEKSAYRTIFFVCQKSECKFLLLLDLSSCIIPINKNLAILSEFTVIKYFMV